MDTRISRSWNELKYTVVTASLLRINTANDDAGAIHREDAVADTCEWFRMHEVFLLAFLFFYGTTRKTTLFCRQLKVGLLSYTI